MKAIIRWGILGTGAIAHTFAQGLRALPDAQLMAVGSRTQAAADRFGEAFGVPHRHGSYEALARDPEVDVIYVATPHPWHMENSLLCLDAGKAVLCEKPFTINADQARRVIQQAREKGLLLVEAMWTRFTPAMQAVRERIAQGAIGEVRMVGADFGFRAPLDPQGRLFDLALGGGSLLDIGVYPISLASMLLGKPNRIASLAHLGQTGADEQAAIILGFPDGQLAVLSSAIRTQTPWEAFIAGTEGLIKIPADWWRPQRFSILTEGKPEQVFEYPFTGNGYNYEAAETMRCLRAGLLESPIMPLDETLAIMETMDAIRAQWGLVYPGE